MMIDSFRHPAVLCLQEINQICYDNLEQAIYQKSPIVFSAVDVRRPAKVKDTIVTVED